MKKTRLHKLISVLVSVGLIFQTGFPAWQLVHAAPNSGLKRKGTSIFINKRITPIPEKFEASPYQPKAVTNPVSISRVQSSYHAGTEIITFTITNNLHPALSLDIPESTTITDTVDILVGLVITEDVNTVRNVYLEDTLINGAILVDASGEFTQTGSTLTWSLSDIPPQGTATITVSVQTPVASTDFIELDSGAGVAALRWGEAVSTSARPAVIVPDGIASEFVQPTVDADLYDQDMLWKSAEFTQDPNQAFEFVRSLDYNPYKASLRGTRGTLWGEAGNALDQSSLLIAMLRAAGIPARYRHGTLNQTDAQTLIASMFPDPKGVAGYLPDGTELADPINDPDLISLVQDHWWVEAYLPGSGWTDLDPSFASAVPGDVFATPGNNDQIAEIPDTLRHKVTFALEVEQFDSFPISGANLTRFIPITTTFNTVELASKSLTIGHLIESDGLGGMVYNTISHIYVPYFAIEDKNTLYLGNEFQDILSSFPLSSRYTTGEWLAITIEDVDGNQESFTRTLKDTIGFDARLNGGNVSVTPPIDNAAFITPMDVFVVSIFPNNLKDQELFSRQTEGMLTINQEMAQAAQTILYLGTSPTPEEQAAAQKSAADYQLYFSKQLSILAYDFAKTADTEMSAIEESLRVKLYYDQPRIIINTSQTSNTSDVTIQSMDLRSTYAQAIVYPGQSISAEFTAQWTKGLIESRIEGEAIQDITGTPPKTTFRLFEAMQEQEIDPILITPENIDWLNLYNLEPSSYAYAVEALMDGKSILIPTESVELDGELTLGWWEFDPNTGETIGVMKDGLHSGVAEYALFEVQNTLVEIWGYYDLGNSVKSLFDWINCNYPGGSGGDCGSPPQPPFPFPAPIPFVPNPLPNLPAADIPPKSSRSSTLSNNYPSILSNSYWRYLPDHICPIDNCGIEQFTNYEFDDGSIPLPDIAYSQRNSFYSNPSDITSTTVSNNNAGGDLSIQVTTTTTDTRALPYSFTSFDIQLDANFDDEVTLFSVAPDGWYLRFDDENTVSIYPAPGTLPGDYTIVVVAQSQNHTEILDVAEQIITVPVIEELAMEISSDSRVTIPVGDQIETTPSNQTNDHEVEVPDSSFLIGLYNGTSTAKTITVTATGAPVGWVILNGKLQNTANVTIPPYNRSFLGLNVVPPTLPAPGINFSINISASDGGSLSANDSINWTMPSQAFNYFKIQPNEIYVASNSGSEINLQITNIGNDTGSFPITTTLLPTSTSLSGISSPIGLNIDEIHVQTATINTNLSLGTQFPLIVRSLAPDSYTQYAVADVQIVSENSAPIFDISNKASDSCSLGDVGLSAALEMLGLAISDLEQSCQEGDCDITLRDEAVKAAESVANYARFASSLITEEENLLIIIDDLSNHTDDADILTDISNISAIISDLGDEMCAIAWHEPSVRWSPINEAILQGDSITYTLEIINQGTLTTTYDVTLTLPTVNDYFSQTLTSGQIFTKSVPLAPENLGLNILEANVVAETDSGVYDHAEALLNVVDRFIQVTAVNADPAFVETGVSSTTLSVEVANIANVTRDATAHTTILSPGGGISYTTDIPIRILAGLPRTYELDNVNTSGWNSGVYTISVDLVDGEDTIIPNGSGWGYFSVGQGMAAYQTIQPEMVPPGTVTVTTIITTELTTQTVIAGELDLAPDTPPTSNDSVLQFQGNEGDSASDQTSEKSNIKNDSTSSFKSSTSPLDFDIPLNLAIRTQEINLTSSVVISGVFTRTEQNEAVVTYSGGWANINLNTASGGNYYRADDPGDSAEFTFYGNWINVGFIGSRYSGHAEIFIDGTSQGILDLYRREDTAVSFIYDNLITATHTISIAVLGMKNDYASNDYVQLDYFDAWNSSMLPDGTFEQNDSRILLSTGWSNVNNAAASGGSYYSSSTGSAWFPFSGDSFSFHYIGRTTYARTHLYVDGQYLDTINPYKTSLITQTISYQGFGPGPHILQISRYRGTATIDAFSSPGSVPFTDPSSIDSYQRYEEDHPAWRYNGQPFITAQQTWGRTDIGIANRSSDDQVIGSSTLSDTAAITVTGEWINIGFGADWECGEVEIVLDGINQGTLDLYRRERGVVNKIFSGLTNTTHTISVTVVGNGDVWVDYLDVWNGIGLSPGTFSEYPNDGFYLSGDWGHDTWPGIFWRSSNGTTWFPFTGDTVTYTPEFYNSGGKVRIYIDEAYQGMFNLYSSDPITDTISFDGLGSSAHILRVESYRGNATLSEFTRPGVSPFYTPTIKTGIIRYEEDDPIWLYNGVPYTGTATTWSRINTNVADRASGDQTIGSGTAGDVAQITVNGEWINLGFAADSNCGQAEIFLDGASQGVVDLYRREYSVVSHFFTNLVNTTHTISVTVIGDGNVWVDYLDVWDGTTLPNGTFYHPDDGFYFSSDWGYYTWPYWLADRGTAWFPFTGDSVSYDYFANTNSGLAKVYIDDNYMGVFDLYASEATTETLSFNGLGSGAHMLRVESYRGNATIHAFRTPGVSPYYTPTIQTGVIRYEEDHPALRYNGLPYTQTVTTWGIAGITRGSKGYYAGSNTTGDSVSLTFDGTWFGVGFLTYDSGGEADIYLDGTKLDTVDLFTNLPDNISVYFDNLVDTTHTVSVTVTGNKHVNSLGYAVRFDYFDVWDGTPMLDGTFEENDDRVIRSSGWGYYDSATASSGRFAASDDGTAWFPFTGETISYQALEQYNTYEEKIKIDGVLLDIFDIYDHQSATETISINGLANGPHVLEIRAYRGNASVDSFTTPGIAPWYEQPAPPTGIIRYEEDDPALLYNGYPFEKSVSDWWQRSHPYQISSNAYIYGTSTGSNWVSLEFTSTWVGVGFSQANGEAEIFIDGTSQGIVDISLEPNVTNIYYDDLITGTHTISVARVSGYVYFDFFDVWDGTDMGEGWFEAKLNDHTGPYHYNTLTNWYTRYPNYNNTRIEFARDADVVGRRFPPGYATRLWFTFTGDDLEFLAFQGGTSVEVSIDGINQGIFDLTPEYSNQPLALYFMDLGEGPHVASVQGINGAYMDAFQVNPPNTLPYTPQVEWHDDTPNLMTTIAIGDLDKDGIVELVAPSHDGTIYVYRGDGVDTGGGTPLLWSTTQVGKAAEPALADLDMDGDAEIVVSGENGTYALNYDGSTYWYTDTIQGFDDTYGWGGPTIGNLDLEPGPEIVIAASGDALYVLDYDGEVLFDTPIGDWPTVPVLSDLTGDGIQDILYAQGTTLTLLDYYNATNIEWTHTHTYTGYALGTFGAPAIADVDGKQPGGDDGPEIVINWGPTIEVLDADGSHLWDYSLGYNYYRPSHVTIADVDGDGEIEILTASALHVGFWVDYHTLFVLNADGTLLWQQNMGDTSASASGVATQDLDGDGIWEVLWNGLNEGFTIMNGPDGTKLFNEKFTESGTILDYPTLGDVDGDGYAEVVAGGKNGIFVIGLDGGWGMSRPVWNQHDYHIDNVNDDLSIPPNAPNSWDIHNTYRTQWPNRDSFPRYSVEITTTVEISNGVVLTTTFSNPVDGIPPEYHWDYSQYWYQPEVTSTFQTRLTNLQPGEIREINQGSKIVYSLPSGSNQLSLPSQFVSGMHIASLSPYSKTIGVGNATNFKLWLSNPGDTTDTYTLTLGGIPTERTNLPPTVTLLAQTELTLTLGITVPQSAETGEYPIIVEVTNGTGGKDQATSTLIIEDYLDVAITPSTQTTNPGNSVPYTLTITNYEMISRTYDLSIDGLASVTSPSTVTVAAESSSVLQILVSSPSTGAQPFGIIVAEPLAGTNDRADAVLDVVGSYGVEAELLPSVGVGGHGSIIAYNLKITNTGDLFETFDLDLDVPDGWTYNLEQNGEPISSVSLNPFVFNAADLSVLVTPSSDAALGSYTITGTVRSQSNPVITAEATATTEITSRGVKVEILPNTTLLNPFDTGVWTIVITNTGTVADNYDLTVTGMVAASGQFDSSSVALNPGEFTTVQLTADNLSFALPQTYEFAVLAESQADDRIQSEDHAWVTFGGVESVETTWIPESRTVTGTLQTTLLLVITNTGNIPTIYNFDATAVGLESELLIHQILILPHMQVTIPVIWKANQGGVYTLQGTATSNSTSENDSDTATLTIIYEDENNFIYIPLILK